MLRKNTLTSLLRAAAIALAVLATASPSQATGLQQSLPPGSCAVSAVFLGSGDVAFLADGEDWVDFSIRLDPNGDVRVDGEVVGQYPPLGLSRIEVHIDDGTAWIEVRDELTGCLHCFDVRGAHSEAVSAQGGVIALDVE